MFSIHFHQLYILIPRLNLTLFSIDQPSSIDLTALVVFPSWNTGLSFKPLFLGTHNILTLFLSLYLSWNHPFSLLDQSSPLTPPLLLKLLGSAEMPPTYITRWGHYSRLPPEHLLQSTTFSLQSHLSSLLMSLPPSALDHHCLLQSILNHNSQSELHKQIRLHPLPVLPLQDCHFC